MKAIILAGGEGTRLRPLSCGVPKPMVYFYGKPVMAHTIDLLRRHGINEITAALCYLSGQIENYFSDGSSHGVKMTYRVERTPLGTAGAVRDCGPFGEDETILVISGDGIADIDLGKCLAFHESKNADVTIILSPHENPLEYGIVLCDRHGRVQRFIEKPTWDQVFTNTVNTGIYIIRASILDEISRNEPVDFSRDLFPALLKKRRKIYGVVADGYWCDIGSCESYLKCSVDMLWKKTAVELPDRKQSLPPSTRVIAPCFIGENVSIGENCIIGPDAVVCGNCALGNGCLVQNSVLLGTRVGENATVFGAVCAKGTVVGRGAIVNEGCVLGEDASIGRDAILAEGVRVWPNRSVDSGTRLKQNLVTGFVVSSPSFSDKAVIAGDAAVELGPETAMTIGSAAALFSEAALSRDKSNFADAMAFGLECGLRLSGGNCVRTDGRFPLEASFAARKFGLPLSVFVSLDKSACRLHFYGRDGQPLSREDQRRMEGMMSRGEGRRALGWQAGGARDLTGIHKAYLEDAVAGLAQCSGMVKLSGAGEENLALGEALTMLGARDGGLATPSFKVTDGVLSAADEDGQAMTEEETFLIACKAALELGWELTVPWDTSSAVDSLAQSVGKKVSRGGRLSPPFVYNGVYSACLIYSYIGGKGLSLAGVRRLLPKFSSGYANIELLSGRAEVMRELAACLGDSADAVSGLRRREKRGWIHIVPSPSSEVLKIKSEADNAEIAAELCADFSRLAKKLDEKIYNNNKI